MDTVNHAADWGIKASGEPDWSAVVEFENRIVDKIVRGLTGLVKQRNIEVVQGTARLVPGGVDVNGRRIDAGDIVIATGSRPRPLPGVELTPRVITSDEALWYDRIPTSAIVIGAGAVGLEFASLYRSLGADVTLLEALPRLAPLEDEDLSKEIARSFRKRGIASAARASVTAIRDNGETVDVTYESEGKTNTTTAELCLVAIGRGPVTEGLGLDDVGVRLNEKGFVEVDGELRTSASRIWAVGDVAATPLQLAHVAFTEGLAVAERIVGHTIPTVDYVNIPRVTYCTPEIASVGLTEAQASEQGREIITERLDFRAIGKANIVGEGGFVKLVAEANGGPVLGVHMIGPHVTDLISEAMLITNWEAVPTEVAALIHPHPTLSEAIGEAHLALAGMPFHSA
jgi:dihydrolipoamide dehydrogenase